jgi:diphthamide biosynthesis methyltransferase
VGIAKEILVRIQDQYIPTDFAILDMGHSKEVSLLLGRPFLNTTHAELHVGIGHAHFYIQGKTLSLPFNGFNMYKHD